MSFSELNSPPIFKRDLSLTRATRVHSDICPQVTPVWSLLCASGHCHAVEVNLFSMTWNSWFNLVIQTWMATLTDGKKCSWFQINLWCNTTWKKQVWIFPQDAFVSFFIHCTGQEKCSNKAQIPVYYIWKLNERRKCEPPTTSSSTIMSPLGRQVVSLGGWAARRQLFLFYHRVRTCCIVQTVWVK